MEGDERKADLFECVHVSLVSKVSTGQVAKVKLKNTSLTPVGYKLKTNAPQKYSVRPVFGVLMPGDSVKVFGKWKLYPSLFYPHLRKRKSKC